MLYPSELPGPLAMTGGETVGYGGAEEDRTPDLRIANATLSQLSYRPMWSLILIPPPEQNLWSKRAREL